MSYQLSPQRWEDFHFLSARSRLFSEDTLLPEWPTFFQSKQSDFDYTVRARTLGKR